MNSPYFSVILINHNMENYLLTSINSVLKQSYTSFELIIIDDGSTDESRSIISNFHDNRIKVHSSICSGAASSRNIGIRLARGEYVAFLDADDLWHPDKLQSHYHILSNDNRIGVSYSHCSFITEDGNEVPIKQKSRSGIIPENIVFISNPINNGSNPVIKKSVLESVQYNGNYFNPSLKYTHDHDLWIRISHATSMKIFGINQSLVFYRLNPHGISSKSLLQLRYAKRMILRSAKKYHYDRGDVRKALANYYLYTARNICLYHAQSKASFKFMVNAIILSPYYIIKRPIYVTTLIFFNLINSIYKKNISYYFLTKVSRLIAKTRHL